MTWAGGKKISPSQVLANLAGQVKCNIMNIVVYYLYNLIEMGHWNYRIMKKKNRHGQFDFGIYEVFYDDLGQVKGCTKNSLTPVCESEDSLKEEIKIMMDAFEKETLIYEELR